MNRFIHTFYIGLVVLGLVAASQLMPGFSSVAYATDSCGNGDILSISQFREAIRTRALTIDIGLDTSALRTHTVVRNNTDCAVRLNIKVYKVFDNVLYNQQYFSGSGVISVPAHGSRTIDNTIPSCMSQVDAYYDNQGPTTFTPDNTANLETFAAIMPFNEGPSGIYGNFAYARGNFCNVPPPPVTGSCAVTPSTTTTGNSVEWSANASGGTGSFTYSWTGTDGLSGTSRVVSKSYTASGTKTGMVTITSGNQSIERQCSMTVQQVQVPTLTGSCAANASSARVGDTIVWTSNVSGGNSPYTYSWSGDDSLGSNSSSVSKSYGSTGTKNATVVITSADGQSITRQCSTSITQEQTQNMTASCYANASGVQIGNTVTWYSNVSGGNGNYTYSWSGDEGLSGNSSSANRSYQYTGTKYANLTVTDSSGRSANAQCSTSVIQNTQNNLSVSCSVDNYNPNVGGNVRWYANASGGNGNYSYNWTGSDGLYGNGQSTNWSYNSSGQKSATVTVNSGGQSMTQTCFVHITQTNYNNLDASCSANPSSVQVGQSVTWTANAYGGQNNNNYYNNYYNNNYGYNYQWSGSDGMHSQSQSFTQTFNTPGTKYATVTVNAGGQSITRTCSVNVINSVVYYPPTTPPSYVYLNQVPYTGIGSSAKIGIFLAMLGVWSAFIAYMVVRKRAMKLATAGVAEESVGAEFNKVYDETEKRNFLDSLIKNNNPFA